MPKRCRNCTHYDADNRKCKNPKRDDSANVFYYGHTKPDDYCTLHESFANGGIYTGPKGVISGGHHEDNI